MPIVPKATGQLISLYWILLSQQCPRYTQINADYFPSGFSLLVSLAVMQTGLLALQNASYKSIKGAINVHNGIGIRHFPAREIRHIWGLCSKSIAVFHENGSEHIPKCSIIIQLLSSSHFSPKGHVNALAIESSHFPWQLFVNCCLRVSFIETNNVYNKQWKVK